MAALKSTALLDSRAEEAFDRLTRLASRILETPAAIVTLLDGDRQIFRSQQGLAALMPSDRPGPAGGSLCHHVIATARPVVIDDARTSRFGRWNLSLPGLDVVAYLGVPLVTAGGQVLGAFCVVDRRPRSWTVDQVQTVKELAASVITEIELRAEISERHHMETALRESDERFRAIFHGAAIGIAVVCMEGRPITSNRALSQLLGYTMEELRQLPFTAFTHPEDRDLDWSLFQELSEGKRESYQLHKRYIRKDGSTLWARLTVSLAHDAAGSPTYAIGMVEDISEHKRADALARELRILEGLLPICVFCKSIRNETGEWERTEAYISRHSEASFTHGHCPACCREHYGTLLD